MNERANECMNGDAKKKKNVQKLNETRKSA